MSAANPSPQFEQGGFVCNHLLESDDDGYQQFTGVAANYNIVCIKCSKNLDDLPKTLRSVLNEQFERLDRYTLGIVGQPQILERPSGLFFNTQEIHLNHSLNGQIRSVAPRQEATTSQWVALLSSGDVVQLDLAQGTTSNLAHIPSSALQLADNAAIYLSHDSRFAAIVNDRESLGVVLDLTTSTITMPLNRGDYHAEQTRFPVAFFQHQGKDLLIHATNWNRLDISDPATGEQLTSRISPIYENRKAQPRYLDYFHALPVVSPDTSWVVEDGWVWQPFGMTRLWSLKRWLSENVWESEDGDSVRYLTQRGYYWNGPLCWIDNTKLAVWGLGNDDEWLARAIQIFDAETGKRVGLFAGVRSGILYFDQYLFSVSREGTEVWDVETGERLLYEDKVMPIGFHPHTHEFLSAMDGDTFRLSRLSELER